MSIRVRFAPSPTGALHIGGIRTALFNYLLAKKHGGTFILRIEDTDQGRYVEGAEQYIVEALKWCGIAPTEGIGFGDGAYGPYRQSERKALYHQYALELVEKGKAYYAFDTPEQLENMRKTDPQNHVAYGMHTRLNMENSLSLPKKEVAERLAAGKPYVIRLKIKEHQTIKINDLIRGEVLVASNELDDKVLMKADGMPTYHLANIVDDYLMKITHVIRGEEWLPSAAHHVLLYKAFGWEKQMPQFAHLPLILKPDGKGKLSKRDGLKFGFPVFPLAWEGVDGFKEVGFDPKALLNFLVLLGWNDGTEKEIFAIEELVDLFSLEKVNKSGARFIYDKAKWFNQQYIMKNSNEILANQLLPLAAAKGYTVSLQYLTQVVGLMKERAIFLNDFLNIGYYCFEPVKSYDAVMVLKKWKRERRPIYEDLSQLIQTLDLQDALSAEHDVKAWIQQNGLKVGEVLPVLRIALAGTMQGPAVFDMMTVLGKAEVVKRLNAAYDYLDRP
jgi:glutamyl-tRNA synthetase